MYRPYINVRINGKTIQDLENNGIILKKLMRGLGLTDVIISEGQTELLQNPSQPFLSSTLVSKIILPRYSTPIHSEHLDPQCKFTLNLPPTISEINVNGEDTFRVEYSDKSESVDVEIQHILEEVMEEAVRRVEAPIVEYRQYSDAAFHSTSHPHPVDENLEMSWSEDDEPAYHSITSDPIDETMELEVDEEDASEKRKEELEEDQEAPRRRLVEEDEDVTVRREEELEEDQGESMRVLQVRNGNERKEKEGENKEVVSHLGHTDVTISEGRADCIQNLPQPILSTTIVSKIVLPRYSTPIHSETPDLQRKFTLNLPQTISEINVNGEDSFRVEYSNNNESVDMEVQKMLEEMVEEAVRRVEAPRVEYRQYSEPAFHSTFHPHPVDENLELSWSEDDGPEYHSITSDPIDETMELEVDEEDATERREEGRTENQGTSIKRLVEEGEDAIVRRKEELEKDQGAFGRRLEVESEDERKEEEEKKNEDQEASSIRRNRDSSLTDVTISEGQTEWITTPSQPILSSTLVSKVVLPRCSTPIHSETPNLQPKFTLNLPQAISEINVNGEDSFRAEYSDNNGPEYHSITNDPIDETMQLEVGEDEVRREEEGEKEQGASRRRLVEEDEDAAERKEEELEEDQEASPIRSNQHVYNFKCKFPKCGQKLIWRYKYGTARLFNHALLHCNAKYIKCGECREKFETAPQLRSHYAKMHKKQKAPRINYVILSMRKKRIKTTVSTCFADQIDMFQRFPIVLIPPSRK